MRITEKKRNASRRNGKLGGRPKNLWIAAIMKARGVSRSRAYQLFKQYRFEIRLDE